MSNHQHEHYRVGFALVRMDRIGSEASAKVVKVVFDPQLAELEKRRLTDLNGSESTTYEVQNTHVFD